MVECAAPAFESPTLLTVVWRVRSRSSLSSTRRTWSGAIMRSHRSRGGPDRGVDFGGSGCQPSLTREKTSQASAANPKMRRKGFTPRNSSAAAHNARAAQARTTRTDRTQPWGRPSHITPDASSHTTSGQLGSWPSVIRPVFRLRNIQARNPARSPSSSGVLNDGHLRGRCPQPQHEACSSSWLLKLVGRSTTIIRGGVPFKGWDDRTVWRCTRLTAWS